MELARKLVFTNNIYMYLLVFLLLPTLVLYGSKVFTNDTYNPEFLSKSSTDCVKGLCILVVIIHHISQRMQNPSLIKPFTTFGYLAVSVFFFLSGYGLMVSTLNKSNYLISFFSKRLSKVYIPFIVVNALTMIIFHLAYNVKYGISQIIMYLLGTKLLDSTLWFVKSILLFYIVFYFAFKFFAKNIAPHLLVIYSFIYFIVCYKIGLGSWWFNTVFCFPIGVYMALYYNKIINFIKRNYIKTVVLSAFCFVITYLQPYFIKLHDSQLIFSTISSVFFIFLTLAFLFKVKVSSKPMLFIGSISYEMYIIHFKVLYIYFSTVNIMASYSIYIYLILVALLAFLLNKIFVKIKISRIFSRNQDSLVKL